MKKQMMHREVLRSMLIALFLTLCLAWPAMAQQKNSAAEGAGQQHKAAVQVSQGSAPAAPAASADSGTPIPSPVSGAGTAGFIPVWSAKHLISNSLLSQTGNGLNVTGTVNATAFAGDGSALSNVNAATLGGLGSAVFAQQDASNVFAGNQTINGNLTLTGSIDDTLTLQGNLSDAEGEEGANFIGGFGGDASYPGNSVAPGVIGATIAGGGGAWDPSSAPPPPVRRVTQPALRANGRFVGRARRSEQQPEAKAEQRSVPSGVVSGSNVVSSGSDWSTIGGGAQNTAGAWGSTVSGGTVNSATNTYATVSGGDGNTASGYESTVGGGSQNTSEGVDSTVAGGTSNAAGLPTGSCLLSSDQTYTGDTVGGGIGNIAQGNGFPDANTPCGYATVAGGQNNSATTLGDTVGGGYGNKANGGYATVPGGGSNQANGTGSFAAGVSATANHSGSFVWSDNSSDGIHFGVSDSGDFQFVALASGGFFFYTTTDLSTGATLPSGSGSWSSISDRNVKDNFAIVDGASLLAKIAALPISTWNYKTQATSIRHMGPMAQDFRTAFGLGEDDKHISNIDSEGVALAAVQALYKLNQEKDSKIAELSHALEQLKTEVEKIADSSSKH
jgi:hypothetical protein